jgi:hypothetical protein
MTSLRICLRDSGAVELPQYMAIFMKSTEIDASAG